MSREITRRGLLAGGAVAALGSLAGCSGLTPFVGKRQEETRTIPIASVDRIGVRTEVGDVRVRGVDRGDVRVRIVKKASSVRTDLSKLRFWSETVDGELRLRSAWTGGDQLFGGTPAMDLEIDVPRSLSVDRVESSVGDLSIRDVVGDSTVQSETGDVTVERADGTITATSQTGDVRVRSPARIGRVSTETGDVVVDVPAIAGGTRLASDVGDVRAAIAPDLDAELTARTQVGKVSVRDLDLADAARNEKLVTGTLGDGGPQLTVETETGNVVLTALS